MDWWRKHHMLVVQTTDHCTNMWLQFLHPSDDADLCIGSWQRNCGETLFCLNWRICCRYHWENYLSWHLVWPVGGCIQLICRSKFHPCLKENVHILMSDLQPFAWLAEDYFWEAQQIFCTQLHPFQNTHSEHLGTSLCTNGSFLLCCCHTLEGKCDTIPPQNVGGNVKNLHVLLSLTRMSSVQFLFSKEYLLFRRMSSYLLD